VTATLAAASVATRAETIKGRHRQPGHRPPDSRSITTSVRRLVRESLFRNTAFLVMNVGFGAVCGFGTLAMLTRFYSVEAIGLTTAAMSAGGLIASFSQFGLNYTLPRFLPSSTQRAALINTVVTVSVVAAALGACLFLALPTASRLYALGGVILVPVFIVSTSLNAASAQLDNVFIADRSARNVTIATAVSSATRLAAPATFIFLGLAGAFVAQSTTAVVTFIVLVILLVRQGDRLRPMVSLDATRELRRFSMGAYVGGQLGSLPALLLPLIVLSRFGPGQSAYWYTAMAIAVQLNQLPGSVARALLAEAAHRPAERRALIRRSCVLIGSVMGPVLVIAYFAAPLGLAILGHHYSVASLTPLRLLIVAGVMTSINYVTGTILYIAKKTIAIAVINAADAVIVVGLAAALARNSADVAVYWLIGEAVQLVLFAAYAAWSLREVHGRWEALGDERRQNEPKERCEACA
jgi:O-antigen/teichoic acid export membrane protein